MLPLLKESEKQSLRLNSQPCPFPIEPPPRNPPSNLDSLGQVTLSWSLISALRYQMVDFAVKPRDLGVKYIGICCGGAPYMLRSMEELLGRLPSASRFSPDRQTLCPRDPSKSQGNEPGLQVLIKGWKGKFHTNKQTTNIVPTKSFVYFDFVKVVFYHHQKLMEKLMEREVT
jgi:hypothetical protein